jgi:hypothetical protein
MYKYSPTFVMKRLILKNFPKGKIDPEVADSVDFVVEKLDTLSREQLASRLTLNTIPGYIEPHQLNEQVGSPCSFSLVHGTHSLGLLTLGSQQLLNTLQT